MNEHGRDSAANAAREIKLLFENLPPAPRFDCIAVCDTSLFDSFPRASTDSLSRPYGYAMFGIPVVIDEDVPPREIELRKGRQ